MNPDKSPLQLIFPVGGGVRIGRLNIDPKEHLGLGATTHHFEQLLYRARADQPQRCCVHLRLHRHFVGRTDDKAANGRRQKS